MNLSYILRLDDACPTDRKQVWDFLEQDLDKYGIKPIVGVIPRCKDKNLMIEREDENFWERIRRYQLKGYAIALHGYEHNFVSRHKGIIPLNSISEFAGLPFELQRDKIRNGFNELVKNGIRPNIWVAPAHTFDKNTLEALRLETDIRIISDGIAFFPYRERDFLWIPQQLWRFKRVSFGVWTICLHPNEMTEKEFDSFRSDLSLFREHVVSLDVVLNNGEFLTRKKSLADRVFANLFFAKRRLQSIGVY